MKALERIQQEFKKETSNQVAIESFKVIIKSFIKVLVGPMEKCRELAALILYE
jgi:hypothetical protein